MPSAEKDAGGALAGLALRVRHEANMAARAGQFDRLHLIADEMEVLASRVTSSGEGNPDDHEHEWTPCRECLAGPDRPCACSGGPCAGCVIPMNDLIEQACEVMHDAYEAAAVSAGWETQQQSRKPWADVPEANKATMRAAVSALLDWLPTTTSRRKPRMTGTGGNRFIPADATRGDLLRMISAQLGDLHKWADDTGQVLDLGAVKIDTRRIPNGKISVTVGADLKDPDGRPPHDA